MDVAIIGAGSRGVNVYGSILYSIPGVKISAICDISQTKLEEASKLFKVPPKMQFLSEDEFFEAGVLADGLIITSQDRLHYRHCTRAIDAGYKKILLEKPVSDDINETQEINDLAKNKGVDILVCHVLRYSAFYGTIHELIKSKKIGELIAINHEENIGYWHFAHSYVRGNWRNIKDSHPLLYAKTCHDFDLLFWFANSKVKNAKSYGSLTYFKPQNAPAGSTERCLDGCPHLDSCAYSVKNLYFDNKSPLSWGLYHATGINHPSQAERYNALKKNDNPYGRCVFKCDNDADDHRSVAIEFENGTTATLTVTAYSKDCHRRIHVVGTHGEILGDDSKNYLIVNIFGEKKSSLFKRKTNKVKIRALGAGHLGGDLGICRAFVKLIKGQHIDPDYLTTIDVTLEGHKIIARAMESD
ncbi:MAG: Gfo/Idh/MocA family oxidoreductase [Christensenellaceae bacterium]|jgi:predicted dehydrogenase|nr:Gfo/Idh/MocA family oxidoreductase [Christensenellaceae bacterium]